MLEEGQTSTRGYPLHPQLFLFETVLVEKWDLMPSRVELPRGLGGGGTKCTTCLEGLACSFIWKRGEVILVM